METVYINRIGEVKKNKSLLEKKLNIKLTLIGNRVNIEGDSLDEYDAIQVIEAISFGFNAKKALIAAQEDYAFRVVHIKDFTKRNLKETRARLIGTQGKTRKTMSEISGCEILINEGEVGIIGYVIDVENVVVAVSQVIRGSKQSNMYQYLEKMNRVRKENEVLK